MAAIEPSYRVPSPNFAPMLPETSITNSMFVSTRSSPGRSGRWGPAMSTIATASSSAGSRAAVRRSRPSQKPARGRP
jgi:hypothetical protein